jgi:DNA modification methylase
LQADGWILRQDIIWHKPNPMPESVRDRCTKAHEYIFLLSKSERYYFDSEAMKEPAICDRIRGPALHRDAISTNGNGGLSRREPQETRNRRSVWTVATRPYKGAHFATFPPDLIEPCVLAGCPAGGTVLDPFGGAGTTGLVADRLGRNAILCELNPEYAQLARNRIFGDALLFAAVAGCAT